MHGLSMSSLDSAQQSDPLSSAPSAASDDTDKPSTVHSARALAAAAGRSQCLEGIAERIIRPMLAAPTLTEEVQAYVCLDEQPEVSGLPAYVQAYLTRVILRYGRGTGWMYAFHNQYKDASGLDWAATTYEQRYSVTVAPHDTAMRREMREFSTWLDEHMYLTTEEVDSRTELGWLKVLLTRAASFSTWSRNSSSVNILDQLVGRKCTQADYHGETYSTYFCFRRRPSATPISFLVFVEMCDMEDFLNGAAMKERFSLSAEEKKRISDKAAAEAVAKAEAAGRERARRRRNVWRDRI